MSRYIKDIIGLGCIVLVVGIFFARLFIPTPHLLVTQDLGRSDAWHFSFATKYALAQSLRAKQLPLWRKDVGDGFPLFAEGQTGALFLPNIIAFYLLDPVPAYSIIMMGAIGSIALGMYLWSRVMGLSVVASTFAGVTSSFFAYPIMQLPHITLLQGTSVMPYLLITTYLMIYKGPWPWMGVFAFLVSQQIFAGFPQATFLTLLLCGWYALWLMAQKKSWKPIGSGMAAIVLGVGGGAAQLLPSWEFLKYSTFPHGFTLQKASLFSFPLKDLWTLVHPYAIGNPKLALYPPAFLMEGNIVWENTIYLGIVPLILILYVALFHRRAKLVKYFGMTALISLVLAWGKYSPLYLLYGLWPFNLFRVPSRFIWITALMLIMLATYGVHYIDTHSKRPWTKMCIVLVLLLHTTQLLSLWWNYHLLVPASHWLTPPPMLQTTGPGRLFTIGEQVVQLRQFTTKGWTDPAPYDEYRKGVAPNSNILWGHSQHDIYAGRFLLRTSVANDLLNRQSMTSDAQYATTSALTIKLLNMFAVTDIFSFLPLTQEGLLPIQSSTSGGVTLSHYRNPTALPRAYTVTEATVAATFESAGMLLQNPQFIVGKHVLLESHEIQNMPKFQTFLKPQPKDTSQTHYPVTITQDTHTTITLKTQVPHDAILVLADTHYPGWRATVDDISTPIVHANFTQRAVYVPKGNHVVTFTYTADIVKKGMYISVVFWSITIVLTVFPISFWRRHTSQTTAGLSVRRRRNHAR